MASGRLDFQARVSENFRRGRKRRSGWVHGEGACTTAAPDAGLPQGHCDLAHTRTSAPQQPWTDLAHTRTSVPLGLFRALMSDVALAHCVVPKLEWGRFQDFPGAVGKAMNTQRSGLVTRPKMCPSKERRCWRMEPDSGRARAERCGQACSASQGFTRLGEAFPLFQVGGFSEPSLC